MQIRNHRIEEIWYLQTSNLSRGSIAPKFIVTHYTTGWSGSGSRDWLLGRAGNTSNRRTSAHVVIDRDGTAWQIAPFNRRAWHAGPSRYGTVSDINTHGIGLEFVNPGWLKPDSSGAWVDYFGHRRTTQQLDAFGGYIERPHPRVGSGTFAWPLFPEAQIEKGLEIASALVDKYPIQAVITHEEIDTRGWKTDPGPAFPQQALADLVDDRPGDTEPPVYIVNTSRLNIRGGPGTEYERIDPPGYLPRNTRVEIVQWDAPWAFVEVIQPGDSIDGLNQGLRGWVHSSYLDREFA